MFYLRNLGLPVKIKGLFIALILLFFILNQLVLYKLVLKSGNHGGPEKFLGKS
jgi:hypothetical protein